MLRKLFKKRMNAINKEFSNKKVLIFDDNSNFFGVESLGAWKVRGNGVLILTAEILFFGMWKPKKELLIPLESILKISNPKTHIINQSLNRF